jgi:uncharacterized protein YukE
LKEDCEIANKQLEAIAAELKTVKAKLRTGWEGEGDSLRVK